MIFCPSSSGVERILGKDEVSGSNPDLGSRFGYDAQECECDHDYGLLEIGPVLAGKIA
jgi:hypothetical protein